MFRTTPNTACLGIFMLVLGALGSCSESVLPTVVLDGKEWMRCALGQTWEGSSCSGEATVFNFLEAQDSAMNLNTKGGIHGKTDWRLPTALELASLRICSNGFKREVEVEAGAKAVGRICNDGSAEPTLDTKQFPNTPDYSFWTSSPYGERNNDAWAVIFGNGYVGSGNDFRGGAGHVRLVRVSQ